MLNVYLALFDFTERIQGIVTVQLLNFLCVLSVYRGLNKTF